MMCFSQTFRSSLEISLLLPDLYAGYPITRRRLPENTNLRNPTGGRGILPRQLDIPSDLVPTRVFVCRGNDMRSPASAR